MKIFIAAGHGGNDPGAIVNNTNERDEVEKIINQTVDLLNPLELNNVKTIKVPNELALEKGVQWINTQNGNENINICIEIHLNSNAGDPGTGTETYYGEPNLANTMHNKIIQILGLKNRGVKNGNHLYFNRITKPASCLIELGFINNKSDLQTIRNKGAQAMTEAIKLINNLYQPKPSPPYNENQKILNEIKDKIQNEIRNLENIRDSIK